MSMAPCDWPIDYSACGGACKALNTLTLEQREQFEQAAIEILWNTTNRVFGVCEVTVRPCKIDCGGRNARSSFWGRGPFPWTGSIDAGSWVPLLIAGQWYNMGCGCAGKCQCDAEGPSALRLPGPVVSVEEVWVNGTQLDPSEYRVMYGRLLVRADGTAWPSCQNLLGDPMTDDDTFAIVYRRGVEVPQGGRLAAGMLACELAKAYCRDATCQLPQRISSVVRDGITVTLMDNFADLKDGSTGIWVIDNWTTSVNRPRPFAGVRSVDVPVKRGFGW